MKELKPKIQFKYDEYVISVADLINNKYQRITQEIKFDEAMAEEVFDAKLLVFLISSMIRLMGSTRRLNQKLINELESDILDNIVDRITDEPTLKMNWRNYYMNYSKLLNGIYEKSGELPEVNQIRGFSLILLEDITLEEEKKSGILVKLEQEVEDSLTQFLKLANNTGMSPKLLGKPNFMVLRD